MRKIRLGRRLFIRRSKTMSEKDDKDKALCEIERKFKVPTDYHQRLESFGFRISKTHESLIDLYFDISKSSSDKGSYLLLTLISCNIIKAFSTSRIFLVLLIENC